MLTFGKHRIGLEEDAKRVARPVAEDRAQVVLSHL
jgi:hypothetical protein